MTTRAERARQRTVRRLRPVLEVGAAAFAGLATALLIRRWHAPMDETVTKVAATVPPPDLPDAAAGADSDQPLQPIYAGTGDLFHRRYQADIQSSSLNKEELMARVFEDINAFVPHELAAFEKTKGEPGVWAVGDEWFVHLTGPWNGPVRVIHVEPTLFAFVTLRGHLEAGEIQFQVTDVPDNVDAVRFEIRSWARSSNLITDFFYRVLGISKTAQTIVWTFFCNQVVAVSGGQRIGNIRVTTHRTHYRPQMPTWQRYSRDFDRWRQTNLNFDPSQRETFTDKLGWRIDDYRVGLPSEPPGDPLPHGSWQAACEVVRNYEFPDPGLITGIFVPDAPLEGRIMILRARFLLFTFYFGVRIAEVIDETRKTEKQGPVRAWGYSYRTLQGHFEMGEITFQVWKYLDSGDVEFRVHAYSKAAVIANPLYRIGFRMFGRSLQRRFARTAMQRMQQLVIARTAHQTPDSGITVPEAASEESVPTTQTEVRPVESHPTASRKADEIRQDLADQDTDS